MAKNKRVERKVEKTVGRSSANVASIILSGFLAVIALVTSLGAAVLYHETKISIAVLMTLAYVFFFVAFAVLTYGLFKRKKWSFNLGFFVCAAEFIVGFIPVSAQDWAKLNELKDFVPDWTATAVFLTTLPLLLLALIWLQKNELNRN